MTTKTEVFEFDNEKYLRQKQLLNDANYGVVLDFLDRFGSILDLPSYPLELFENHLINYQEKNSRRFVDFHFILLKRLSLGRKAQHDKFDSIITKFTAQFDINDSEHLKATGYLKANIGVKLRIIKNLLESQFDLNQTLKSFLSDKTANDIKTLPFGRDRFGASYWFFMDKNSFVRMFREDADIDRTWTHVVKNLDELEDFIKSLIIDDVVRLRFPDWVINCERFSSLFSSSIKEPSKINSECIGIRRSSRLLQRLSTESHLSTAVSQIPLTKKKISTKIKKETLNKRRSIRRCKTKRQRKRDYYLCSLTSSSDECADDQSEDECNSDDYIHDQLQMDLDRNFFELETETENKQSDEQLFHTKTASTLTVVPCCDKCSKNDRPEILLLCNDCNDAYHLDCLYPVLSSIPDYHWYCPLCEQKKLANRLIDKFNELLIHHDEMEMKRKIRNSKASVQRKVKSKVYSSDESVTASETDDDTCHNFIHDDQVKFSNKQTSENSNLSSSCLDDDSNCSISQRGRRRRTRFDIKELLNNYDKANYSSNKYSSHCVITNGEDDECSTRSYTMDFELQLPKKMSSLLHRFQNQSTMKTSRQKQTLSHSHDQSSEFIDTAEHSESLDDSTWTDNTDAISQQTSQIMRRWNDVKRRSRLRAIHLKLLNETTLSEYTDENSLSCTDDLSLSVSNNSYSNNGVNEIQTVSTEQSLSMASERKVDTVFNQLTTDIQFAIKQAHSSSTKAAVKTNNRKHVKHTPKLNGSLYAIKTRKSLLPCSSSQAIPSSHIHSTFSTKTLSNSISFSSPVQTISKQTCLYDVIFNETTSGD